MLLTGDLELGDEAPKVLVKNLEWVAQAHKGRVQKVVLRLKPAEVSAGSACGSSKSACSSIAASCPVRIDFVDASFKTRLELPGNVGVQATPALVTAVNGIFGRDVVALV